MVHFSFSILMLHSKCMVLLHLKNKILCSRFLSHHSYSDFIYLVIETPTSYLNFEIQKQLKVSLKFGNYFDEHHVQKLRVGVHVCLSLKQDMVKNTLKSFVRENKFHTYLIRKTLPAVERVRKFHDKRKAPSYQTIAEGCA